MSKIISAVNAMISQSDKISGVMKNRNEYYFLFAKKYKWSISKDADEDYRLHFYPGDTSLQVLSCIDDGPEWEGIDIVTYATKDLKTPEARETLIELYLKVKENVFGIDRVLKDIIDMDMPFD